MRRLWSMCGTTWLPRACISRNCSSVRTASRFIDRCLPDVESRIWHSHPVWFIDGNPIVGYSKLKGCVRLLFWSGRGFQTPGLHPEGTFQAAEARYTAVTEIDAGLLERWLAESRTVQWDYQHIRTRGLVRIG